MHFQWAVTSFAVFPCLRITYNSLGILMALFTKPKLTCFAAVDSYSAAKHTLPFYELSSVTILADIGADTHLFEQARAANKIFSPSSIFHLHFSLAVNEATKVRLIAFVALVEANLVLGKLY